MGLSVRIEPGKMVGTEDHAKKLIVEREKFMWRQYADAIQPKGISHHQVRYAKQCAECEQTYWTNNRFATHKKCPGPGGSKLGFGA